MSIPRDGGSRSANDETASDRISSALSAARKLIRYGVPVFPARVDDLGDPDTDDSRWARWQRYPADIDVLQSYRPGDAMSAVCGHRFDVIDIDPRNGGKFSFNRMADDLGDFGPVVYGKVKTPSGGTHLYIASLGIGSHNGVMPGIDLKGGNPDGTGRGFVFLPPTIRPVKGLDGEGGVISGGDAADRIRMGTYRWTEPIQKPGGDASSEELTGYILAAIEAKRSSIGKGVRESANVLRKACIKAEAGGQRAAMLRYVHELERRGYAREDILVILRSLAGEMPVYDKRRPWWPAQSGNPDRELLTLFHREGTIIPDAAPGELDGMEGPSVARVLPVGLTSFAEVDRALTRWLWARYVIRGGISMIDGDAGSGKSAITLDLAARITTGDLMPDGSEIRNDGSGAVLLLAPEDSDSVTAGRLEAAGADIKMVYRPALTLRKKHGKEAKAYSGNELLSFPGSVNKVCSWIKAYNIKMVIVDPISAFLDEDVNSNNDASVRRALAPLAHSIGQLDCAAIFIRHYNKDTSLKAQHRGGGSVAFGAIVRVHMVVGEVPIEDRANLDDDTAGRVYAITQVKNNQLERKPDEALAYTIEDSNVVADTEGNMAPRVRWLGNVMVSADRLASGDRRRGPTPMVQDEIIAALTEMFENVPIWDSQEALAELNNAGITANRETIAKARARMGVVAKQRRQSGQRGVAGWDWTLPSKRKVDPESEED